MATLSFRHFLPVAILLASSPFAAMQSPFEEPVDRTRSRVETDGVAAADLNGDGLLDLVLVSAPRGGVKVALNEGGSGFAPDIDVVFGLDRPVAWAVGDFFQTGDVGVAVLLRGIQSFEVYLVEMVGGQAPTARLLFSGAPANWQSLSAGDVNGDGFADLVVGGVGDALAYLNLGSAFDGAPRVVTNELAFGATVADVDADGYDDVAYHRGSPTRDWVVARGTMTGDFLPPVAFLPASLSSVDYVAFGDVDGDGDADVAVGPSFGPLSFSVLESLGGLSYGARSTNPAPNFFEHSPEGVVLEDVDGDGLADLVYGDMSQVQFQADATWRRALGGVDFGGAEMLLEDVSYLPLALADLSGDGTPELVARTRIGRAPQVYLPTGSAPGPRFLDSGWFAPPVFPGVDVYMADLDGDGDQDFVFPDPVWPPGGELIWIENQGDDCFAPPAVCSSLTNEVRLMDVADANGDGLEDLLFYTTQAGLVGVQVRYGLGPLQFGPLELVLDAGGPVIDAAFNDFDGDGDLDVLVTVGFFPSREAVAVRNEPAGFVSLGGVLQGEEVVYIDVNGDSALDVASFGQGLNIAVNGGAAGFAPPVAALTFGVPDDDPTAFDVDSDGDVDILGESAGRWRWSQNDGLGQFSPFTNLDVPPVNAGSRIYGADLNGDGLIDLISNNGFVSNRVQVQVRLREPSGSLAAPYELYASPVANVGLVGVQDLDADGDDDVVLTGLNVLYTLRSNLTEHAGAASPLCPVGEPNSSGLGATVRAIGSNSVSGGGFELLASKLPPNRFGIFVGSRSLTAPMHVAGTAGSVCLGGLIGRYDSPSQILSSGTAGLFRLTVDPGALETPNGTVAAAAGSTWGFQAWHRDTSPQGSTSNFTGAVAITFEP